MTVKGRFALSRASVSDLPEISRLQYKCFPQFIREIFMGCKTEADLPRIINKYTAIMSEDLHDIWIKVVDTKTGKIAAASNWKIHPNGASASSDDQPAEWLEGEELEKSRKTLESLNEARRKANPGGYVHLHICFTDPDYRRQGAGGMMMQWGCDVADQLFLPGWIEASPEGNHLYKLHGFYDFGSAAGGLSGTNMKRDARKTVIQGGKP
ncbi:hypothetical protein QBC33DRAFT_255764 [Phialemonium atrogriseum]|uniref:N-acetyltransferase domain-containing protein n=1 Tax=Phialemonium atrogriseum TaxID=1093897 RepID=A0AAJ0FD52_9PEZI|nr:uncharacterized protein QBC33DRAFT_255764 [Phialemonium atrogriseum]KAK1762837.1 hypothetical protein QBC33DRAFT_255764 [Phialemonium atrogriseum]